MTGSSSEGNQEKMLNDVSIPYKNVTLKILQSSNTDSCTAVSTLQLWKGKENNKEKDGLWPFLTS